MLGVCLATWYQPQNIRRTTEETSVGSTEPPLHHHRDKYPISFNDSLACYASAPLTDHFHVSYTTADCYNAILARSSRACHSSDRGEAEYACSNQEPNDYIPVWIGSLPQDDFGASAGAAIGYMRFILILESIISLIQDKVTCVHYHLRANRKRSKPLPLAGHLLTQRDLAAHALHCTLHILA